MISQAFLLGACSAVVFTAAYFLFIRPMLIAQAKALNLEFPIGVSPGCRAKLAGLKQKIVGTLIACAVTVVELHDWLAPQLAQAGIDVTKLTDKIPAEAWPIVTLATIVILNWFRTLADKRAAADPLPPPPPEPPKV